MIDIIKKIKELINIHPNTKYFYDEKCTTEDEQVLLKNKVFTGNLEQDIQELKTIFDCSSDIIYREFQVGNQKGTLIFLDGLVNTELMDADILKPLFNYGKDLAHPPELPLIKQLLLEQVITAAQISEGQKIQDIIDHVLSGDTVVLIDGVQQALFISLQQWDKRSVEEPSTEPVVRGLRERFTENLRTNTTLIRRRLKTPKLKMESLTVGRLSKTSIVITYLEGTADDSLVKEVRGRINHG